MENTDQHENSQEESISEFVWQPERESENQFDLSNKKTNTGKEELKENIEKSKSLDQLLNEMYQENKNQAENHEKEEMAKDEIVDVDVKVEILEEDPSGKGDLLNSMSIELTAGIKK